MTSRDFCYWLQGFFELHDPQAEVTARQVQIMKNHLNLVFKHEIDPSMPDPTGELQATHDGVKKEIDDLKKEVKEAQKHIGKVAARVPPAGLIRC